MTRKAGLTAAIWFSPAATAARCRCIGWNAWNTGQKCLRNPASSAIATPPPVGLPSPNGSSPGLPGKGEKTTAVKTLADDAMLSAANTLRFHALAGYYQDGWDQWIEAGRLPAWETNRKPRFSAPEFW